MINVTILAMENTSASAITGPMDVFHQAGVLWNYFNGKKITPHFHVKVVTVDGAPFKCTNGLRMAADGSIADVKATDLIVVSSIINVERTLQQHAQTIHWLAEQYHQGAHIASICTGSFLLAETGLLDGKIATTYWAYAEQFKKRYPRVQLMIERPITEDQDLFCSGGYHASIDISLYLVEKYCGQDVASQSSKIIVPIHGPEIPLPPRAGVHCHKTHDDDQILTVQEWIETHFHESFDYDELAYRNHMSRRTLERRFKAATGKTPLSYQQCVRVKAAKQMLESGTRSFDDITYRVGYEDSSTFRKMFQKYTRLSPSEYRRRKRLPQAKGLV
jgi:transcriptional regulator GlxA family with amidase domain